MRVRSPMGMVAALALCVLGAGIIKNANKKSAELQDVKARIAKMNSQVGDGAAPAADAGTPTEPPTEGAILLEGMNPNKQTNDQQTNFQTMMLNFDNPNVDTGRKNDFQRFMSFWKNKRKENKLGQNSPFIPTPEYHAKAVRDKIYKGRAVPPPSRCFQKKKCDVFGDMAQHGDWVVNHDKCRPDRPDYEHSFCTKKNETWVPRNKDCGEFCPYTPKEACAVLGRSRDVIIAGDSLMRQLYQGMSCIVSNDYKHCALQKHLWKTLDEKSPVLSRRAWCKGRDLLWCSYTNTLELKTDKLDGNPCGGNVTVHLDGSPALATKEHADYVIMMLNKLRPYDVVIVGSGLWDGLDTNKYIKDFLTPIVERANDPNWKDRTPLLIWIPPHTTFYPRPTSKIDPPHLYDFSIRTAAFMRKAGIPVFETINLGLDVPHESYDGLHFVGPVNLHKASLLLRYLESLYIERGR